MVFEQIPYLAGMNHYARAAIVFFVLFIVLRIILMIVEKIFIKLTAKTTTDVDDIILKKSSKPLTFMSLILSLLIAMKEVTFVDSVESIVTKILYSLLAAAIAYLIFAIVDIVLVRVWKKFAEQTESDIDDTIGHLVHEVMRIVLIFISVLIILNIWGLDIGPLLAGLGIAGLAVALALQPTLANIFSGLSIIIDGTFKVGDVIKIDSGEMGEVYKIGLRTTRIKTFDNEMLIIPNSNIANSKVQNFFQPDMSIRVNLEFGVEYGVDPEYVKKIAIEEIEKIKIINKDEEVRALFTEMADSSLNFKVMFWVKDISDKWPAHQEAITRVYRRLYKEKIGIPYPQQTVWLRDEGKAKSPDPSDTKYKTVKDKYYPAFGHEYKPKEEDKEEDKEEKPKHDKKKNVLSKFKIKKK